jgi:hypothetical protein
LIDALIELREGAKTANAVHAIALARSRVGSVSSHLEAGY